MPRRRVHGIHHECNECGMVTRKFQNQLNSISSCPKCSNGTLFLYRNKMRFPDNNSGILVFRKVESIGQGLDRQYGVWTPVVENRRLSVYATCVGCGSVNDITDISISRSGYCGCFHCAWCHGDHFIFLKGWKEGDYSSIARTKKVRYSPPDVRRGKWTSLPKDAPPR